MKNLLLLLILLFFISIIFLLILKRFNGSSEIILGGSRSTGSKKITHPISTQMRKSNSTQVKGEKNETGKGGLINYEWIKKFMKTKFNVKYLHDELFFFSKKHNQDIPVCNEFLNKIIVKKDHERTKFKKGQKDIIFKDNISKAESALLSTFIHFNDFNICGEVGLAFGTSAISILEVLKKKADSLKSRSITPILISMDPFQSEPVENGGWDGIGLENIKKLQLSKYHEFYEDYADNVFPILKNRGIVFDLFFIDGSHKYEDVLNDTKNALMVTRVGGVLVFDDVMRSHPGSHYADLFLKKYLVTGGILGHISDNLSNYSMGVYVKLKDVSITDLNRIFSKENITSLYPQIARLVKKNNYKLIAFDNN